MQFLESQRQSSTNSAARGTPEAFYNALNHQSQIANKQVRAWFKRSLQTRSAVIGCCYACGSQDKVSISIPFGRYLILCHASDRNKAAYFIWKSLGILSFTYVCASSLRHESPTEAGLAINLGRRRSLACSVQAHAISMQYSRDCESLWCLQICTRKSSAFIFLRKKPRLWSWPTIITSAYHIEARFPSRVYNESISLRKGILCCHAQVISHSSQGLLWAKAYIASLVLICLLCAFLPVLSLSIC